MDIFLSLPGHQAAQLTILRSMSCAAGGMRPRVTWTVKMSLVSNSQGAKIHIVSKWERHPFSWERLCREVGTV